MKQIVALLAAIVLGGVWIQHQKAQVDYVDDPCPVCGSNEVLDLGTDEDGRQHARCFDCKADYYILNEEGHE